YEKDAFLHYLDLGPQFSTLNKFLQHASSKKSRITSISKITSDSDIDKEGKISDVMKVGQSILVQVSKEPISSKGPRLTSEISIAGRYMVLLPFSEKVTISQKIKSGEERNRLKKLIQSIKPKKFGVIIRTAAEGKKVAELDQELKKLVAKWESLFNILKKAKPPVLLIGELDRTIAMLRDIYSPNFSSIYVNDPTSCNDICDYLETIVPEKKKIVKQYTGKLPIFEHFGIDKQIKSLFGKTVSIKNGAYLIVEHTEAFHVIDVNSGNRSKAGIDQETNAMEVNMAAVEEIARQLRLRDMGGIIVIDFIDMHNADNRQKIYDHMKAMMAADRSKHNILPLSKFCLMQITRQRVRPEQHVDTAEVCPVCNGTGKVTPTVLLVDEIESKMEYLFKDLNKKKLTIQVHPFVAAYLTKGWLSLAQKWRFKYLKRIQVEGVSSLSYLDCHFLDENLDEMIL
ncbi:MAG: Rne/Rng family ribonuclease, partial [Bacteroidota bacterium]|nr:Rne/Rng family ribonuclease [Bacteroidota bacterium]